MIVICLQCQALHLFFLPVSFCQQCVIEETDRKMFALQNLTLRIKDLGLLQIVFHVQVEGIV